MPETITFQGGTARPEKGKIIIELDTTKSKGRSASGKTEVFASTRGAASVAVDGSVFKLNLNLYR